MANMLKTLVKDYGWIHTSLGVAGNATFVVGSVLFLPQFDNLQKLAVWLFIVGSVLMLVGALGSLAVKLYDDR